MGDACVGIILFNSVSSSRWRGLDFAFHQQLAKVPQGCLEEDFTFQFAITPTTVSYLKCLKNTVGKYFTRHLFEWPSKLKY